ncbi:MAG: GNAT family N-acetyltransferase [Deltaproteobacteria bacterium]|nr:GNAT family N-acetyltransferase [Deltaproteobacteria bacterium]
MHLRDATPADCGTLLNLIKALAEYEREPDAVIATEADLLRDGFGPTPRFHARLAELDGKPVGFALWFFVWSTWQGRCGLYLEDLFVLPEARGHGVGAALLRDLAARALQEGCTRFQWQVLDWNTPAIGFYEKLGAKALKQWIPMRVEGVEAIRRVAEGKGA